VSAYIGAGLVKGALDTIDHSRGREEREGRRAEAKTRRAVAKMKADEFAENQPLRKTESELQLIQATEGVRQLKNQIFEQATYRTFDAFRRSGDPRELNNFLRHAKQTPEGEAKWGKWVTFKGIKNDPNAKVLLSQAGVVGTEAFLNDPELVKSMVIGVAADGSETLIDMKQLYNQTRYPEYTAMKDTAAEIEAAKLGVLLRQYKSAEQAAVEMLIADGSASNTEEALEIYRKSKGRRSGGGGSSILERAVSLIKNDPASAGLSNEELYSKAKTMTQTNTATHKDSKSAEVARAGMDAVAPNGDFFSMDMNNLTPKQKSQLRKYANDLQAFTKHKFSREEEREIRDIKELIHLGKTVGDKLTNKETGIIDRSLNEVGHMISNSVDDGDAGQAAYSTFMMMFLKSISGAAVSLGEAERFREAAGSLKDQLGPVLNKFREQIKLVKVKLEAVYDAKDEYLSYYHLGSTVDNVDDAIRALDERLAMFTKYETGLRATPIKKEEPAPAQGTPDYIPPIEGKPQLGEIFKQ